jgi:mannonate dehydratase
MRPSYWLWNLTDESLRFAKQIGVDDVDMELEFVPGYETSGCTDLDALLRVTKRVESFGLHIRLVTHNVLRLQDAYLQGPQAGQQIENFCTTIRHLGQAGIPMLLLRPFNGAYLSPIPPGLSRPPGFSYTQGRGGYARSTFNLDDALRTMDAPLGDLDAERIWEGILTVYRRAVPVAEDAGVRLCQHGNDPPLPRYRGLPQVLHNFAAFDRLFTSVPSPNNGMLFCIGARYESGEDIFTGIRHFGAAGRIFHVHLRNVIGTLPANRQWAEVCLDEGDIDIPAVIRALRAIGYDGSLNIDHIPILDGDTPDYKAATAWQIGYVKSLLSLVK